MTDSTTARGGSLSTLKLAELQQVAGQLGLKGTTRMRKSDLVEAIRAARASGDGASSGPSRRSPRKDPTKEPAATQQAPAQQAPTTTASGSRPEQDAFELDGAAEKKGRSSGRQRPDAQNGRSASVDELPGAAETKQGGDRGQDRGRSSGDGGQDRGRQGGAPGQDRGREGGDDGPSRARQDGRGRGKQEGRGQAGPDAQGGAGGSRSQRGPKDGGGRAKEDERRRPSVDDIQLPEPRADEDRARESEDRSGGGRGNRRSGRSQGAPGGSDQNRDQNQNQNRDQNEDSGDGNDSGDRGGRRRRGRDRNRDRKRRGGRPNEELAYDDVELSADDVLIPVAGILDILDNYAFVRTSGYLPGPNDVYVSLNQVKKAGLRRGDAIVGAVRQPREGENQGNQRQKFNALVRLDTVNGFPADESGERPEFGSLTPLYPEDRLQLETRAADMTPRIIDIIAPLGKGQRGLIVAPPKAGKTIIMQQIANAISANNPEVHLMVVLVDERPEEVTDMERTVKGEVVSSTFDRPASDHTVVAELAIERAKRLVELGQDVVVLLDSLTRLSRAYNLAAPPSGRILSGGVDASALYPPKKFFGAARNIEHGGSLTILASALVETGSKMDEVIFEEFKGTGNLELRLSRQLADKRIFPAVDVNSSGTRREEILIDEDELQIVWKLRRVLAGLDQQQAIELLLTRLRASASNTEFLLKVAKTTPSPPGQKSEH